MIHSKQPLILLHGALGSKAHFDQLVPLLSTEFEVYTLNFQGHGGEELPEQFSIDLFAQDLADFLNKRQLKNVAVFGYSMGGYVALHLAAKEPELISHILTYGTKFDWTPESADREARLLNPETIEEKVPLFATKLGALHQPMDWKEVVGKTAEMMLRMGNGETMNDSDYAKILCPVCIAWGTADLMVSAEESKNIASKIPGAQFVELKNLPHPIDKIEPTALRNFIVQNLIKTVA